jgi:hypothetical protein
MALCSELARNVLGKIGPVDVVVAEEEMKTWLLEVLFVEIGEDGTGEGDGNARVKGVLVNEEYLVRVRELLMGGAGQNWGHGRRQGYSFRRACG